MTKVALFIGTDITAHLVLNKIVPDMLASGFKPVIYLPDHRPSGKAHDSELKEAGFYERGLNNDVVYPFLEKRPFTVGGKNLSPKALAEKYHLHIEHVKNVNDPEFIRSLNQDPALIGGLSVRCFQIFKKDIIDFFKEKEFFLNMHPGLLPTFKGVMSTVRAMAAGERKYGWTLHEIDEGIDTGNILWQSAKKIDLNKTGLMANIDLAQIGADSIKRAIDTLKEGNVLSGYPQTGLENNYYSYPDAATLLDWKNKGIRLADADEITGVLVREFSDATTKHGIRLSAEISRAINAWHQEQTGITPLSSRSSSRGRTVRGNQPGAPVANSVGSTRFALVS